MKEFKPIAFFVRKVALIATATFAFASLLHSQPRQRIRDVTSLTDVVTAVEFSPDGRSVAVARGSREDNRVEIWDTQSGKLRHAIKGFDGPVWSVSFSPDGRVLVTASGGVHKEKVAEKTNRHGGTPFTELKWWDAESGELQKRIELLDEDLVSIAAMHSPDGRLLATLQNRMSAGFGTLDARSAGLGRASDPFPSQFPFSGVGAVESDLKLIDAQTGELRLKIKKGFGAAVPIFGPASRLEVFASFGSVFRVKAPLFSPNGQYILGWRSNEARLWSTSTGAEGLKIKKFKGRLSAVAFSPDGGSLAGAVVRFSIKNNRYQIQSEIRVWEIPSGKPMQVLPLTTNSVSSLVFASNGQQLLIGGLQNGDDNHTYASMELADLRSGSLGKLLARDEGTVSSVSLSPGGDLIAFQVDASTVKLVETNGWRTRYTLSDTEANENASLRRFMVTVKTVSAVAFVPDGKTIAGEIEDGAIKLWDARTGEVKQSVVANEGGSLAAISANGGTIATLADDGTLDIVGLATGTRKTASTPEKSAGIALSGDGKILALAQTHQIVLMNAENATFIRKIEQANAVALALSFNGEWLAATSSEGAVKIWTTRDGTLRQTLENPKHISALRFASRNSDLAIGYQDGSVALWNTQTGAQIFESKKHSAAVNAIAFSADGMMMATGGDDRSAVVWDVASGKSRRTLKGHDLAITSLAFSPDGTTLAVGSGNASVVLWQLRNGRLDRVLR